VVCESLFPALGILGRASVARLWVIFGALSGLLLGWRRTLTAELFRC